ncbi:long-chain fatty acid--CoA ligase [Georgenia sp. TF02-10]|uniref:AMP-dependent synthetase/ligase n=1 Tax=Georgenia sp. TF02-10 TaxID=2917725 RepID=UPI001FA751CC|nr:long-chain fatty acid--CoA ligase [Georgenia sp. TF02-10]UNX53413.1 long-chain fatty acid--CoA ligase [Georgenia sp. TF02-10]
MDEFTLPRRVHVDPTRSITDYLVDFARSTPQRVLYEEQVDGAWVPHDAAWTLARVEEIAKGLIAAGIGVGDRVGIMSHTRLEWTLVDLAAWHAGAVPVPVYETSSASQAHWILSDADVAAVVVEDAGMAATVAAARQEEGGLPHLRHVWQIDGGGLTELAELGKDVPDEELAARRAAVGLSDLATIIYTSGTTGRPKGVELTHGNFVELCLEAIEELGVVVSSENSRSLLFLPLAHVFARFVEVLVLLAGRPLGHTPDTKQAVADFATFRPTFILSVPRVWERVFNGVEARTGGGVKLKIFRWAARTSIGYSRALDKPGGPSAALRAQHRLADKLVLGKIRDALGGQAQYAVSGGAALGERLGHFYRGVGLTVLEGYGLTETTAPTHVNRPDRLKIGTVGLPLPGTEVRIAPDGEILVRGIGVFRGYHNNPEANAAAITDGWFRTGDLGSMDEEGFLRITGRKKEIIVTAGGKNVAPAPLEDPVQAHPLVSQCVVVGDGRPFIGALITLDGEMLPQWLATHGREDRLTVAEAARDPQVREHIQATIDRVNSKVSRAESIRAFQILTEDFTVENGYLTPSLKIKRNRVLADYADVIDRFYADAAAQRAAETAA